MISEIPTSKGADGVFFFPVRHYSPASARLFLEMADALSPDAVLIEGPVDFNPSMDDLFLGHRLPIAIYSYVRYSDDSRQSAFYPFCEYSPEWQAVEWARDHKKHVEFIDLSWNRLHHADARAHRYSDAQFQTNPYVDRLCERMQVSEFDELWDLLFELSPQMGWEAYMERCHHFCHHMRVFGGSESPENADREDFMAECIEAARERFDGNIIVVTGGYHSSGLLARLQGRELVYQELPSSGHTLDHEEPEAEPPLEAKPEDDSPAEPVEVIETGITLTPFTYERIDRLSGYQSGVHGPAFYEYVWKARKANQPIDCQPLLYEIVKRLRTAGQIASTADVVAIESTARALATIRGRTEIWRFDLLDALSAALVKEAQDAEYMHPMLVEARKVFLGTARGAIADGAQLPPLVQSTYTLLERLNLSPGDQKRRVELDLDKPEDIERSRVLHQCVSLRITGFEFEGGTDFMGRDDLTELWEHWSIRWSPEFEAALIENAIYGSDLADASTARLGERVRSKELQADTAAAMAVEAVLMGLDDLSVEINTLLAAAIAGDGDFFAVAKSLGHLAFIDSFQDVFGATTPESKALLDQAYHRTIWLFESLGVVKDRNLQLIDAVRSLHMTFRRSFQTQQADYDEYLDIFGRTGRDRTQSPMTRGCALGAVFSLGELDTDEVLQVLQSFSDPMELGDFLIGFFSLAREAAQQDPRLMQLLDAMLQQATEPQFLEMLPGLRLAFTFFTPLEKHNLINALFAGAKDAETTTIDPEVRRNAAEVGRRMAQTALDYGLRGADALEARSLPGETADLAEGDDATEAPTAPEPAEPDPAPDEPEADETSETGEIDETDESGDSGETEKSDEGSPAQTPEERRKTRWKLVMGAGTEGALGELDGVAAQQNQLVGFLYDREYSGGRNIRGSDRKGGLGESQLSVPDWINGIHELFPKRTIERLEKDALDRYELEEIVTRPDVLSRAQPNMTLLKAVLRTKHLMSKEVLDIARQLIRKVVEDLLDKLAREIQSPFSGALDRRRRSHMRVHANFDADETIRRNLKNFDSVRGKLVVHAPYFFSRVRRHVERWQIIVVVDQSGSMMESVIHSAITAAIFHKIKRIRTHLIAFDTNVVDLSDHCDDPVETLMSVQLGGGTDIANALEYAYTRVDNPSRTIMVLITDFCEGGPVSNLLAVTKKIVESGVNLLGLAALDAEANPFYDRETAQKMVQLGAHVGAMTPGELAAWIAERIQ